MFVLIFVNSWLISIGFKFWMIEAAFAPIGQAEICSFIVPSFFLKPPTGRLPLSRLTCLPHPIAQFRFAGFATKRFGFASVCWSFRVSSRADRHNEGHGSIARTLLDRRTTQRSGLPIATSLTEYCARRFARFWSAIRLIEDGG
jgi:hypothetical protein